MHAICIIYMYTLSQPIGLAPTIVRKSIILSRVYKKEEGEYRTPYCRVQTPFEEYRGRVTQYYTLTYHKRLARNARGYNV